MSKENVYFNFLQRLEQNNEINVTFNDWSDDDDDDVILPFRPLNSPKQSDDDDDNDDDDDESSKAKKRRVEQLHTNCLPDNTTLESIHSDLMIKLITKMRNAFMRYCRQLPVIGFNSGKYDLNLIKGKIAYHL